MGKYKDLVSDTIIFGVGNFLTKLISFFLMPIYTSDMSPEAFGVSDLLSNSLSLCIPILSLSIAEAVFRFTIDDDSNPKVIFTTGLKVAVISYGLIVPISVILYFSLKEIWWVLMGILYITESLKTLLAQFSRGLHHNKIFALSGIINAVLLFVFTYLFISLRHWEVTGYLLSFIISNFLTIVFLGFSIKIFKYVVLHTTTITKEMLKYCIPLIPNTLSWWFTNISSRYVIAFFCGVPIAGLYSAASRIPALINVVATIFQQAWQYATVKNQLSDDRNTFFNNVFIVYTFLIFGIGSIIITFLPYISIFVLKGEFYAAWIYTPSLLLVALLGCFSIFFGTFYQMLKKSKKIMNTTIVGAVANILISVLLVPILGVWGALVASIIGYGVIVIYRFIDCRNILGIRFPIKIPSILFIIVCVQVVWLSFGKENGALVSIILSCILVGYCSYEVIKMISQYRKQFLK